jgi:hypothetical protein
VHIIDNTHIWYPLALEDISILYIGLDEIDIHGSAVRQLSDAIN